MSATATVDILEGGVKFHTESKLILLIFLMPMSTVFSCKCISLKSESTVYIVYSFHPLRAYTAILLYVENVV
jgi:hypothetical protein